jgi:hypothetical protein
LFVTAVGQLTGLQDAEYAHDRRGQVVALSEHLDLQRVSILVLSLIDTAVCLFELERNEGPWHHVLPLPGSLAPVSVRRQRMRWRMD